MTSAGEGGGGQVSRTPPKAPLSVDVAVTGRCNLRCAHCYYADEMFAKDDLPTAEWLAFFEELRDCGVMRVTLTGGEPFVRSDVWELIESVVRNKMRFSILTNGTLISDDVAHRLTDFRRRLDYVQVSVDGSCPETHDRLRGPGAFARLMAGIAALTKEGLQFSARVTVSRLNVHDLEATLHMLYRAGLQRFSVNEAYPMGAGHCNHQALEMSIEERRMAFRVMREFDRAHPGVVAGASAGPLVVAELIESVDCARQGGAATMPFPTGALTGCNVMWQKLAVLHDGTYVPCHQLSHMAMGRLGSDSLSDIWLNAPVMAELRERHTVSLEVDPRCAGCAYQQYCTGGCPGVAFAMTGGVNRANPRDCYRAYIGEDPEYAY